MAYTRSTDLNYIGTMFALGNRQTPFLNAIGAPIDDSGNINSAVVKTVSSFEFPVAVPYDTGAGAIPNIDEVTSVTGVTATTITRGQDMQTCQIFMQKAEVSYKKLSTPGTILQTTPSSHNIDGQAPGMATNIPGNPVQNEMDFQLTGNLKKLASDLNLAIITGQYQGAATAATAAKMRGLKYAISTNAVAAGSAYLSQAHINACIKKMVDAGALLQNIVCLCNSFQRQRLGSLYENVPMSRTEGGSQITKIYTDFGVFEPLYDPSCPVDEIYFVEMSMIRFVVCPVNGKLIVIEDKPTDGASYAKQIYGQFSIDYGPEEYHGKVTGLLYS